MRKLEFSPAARADLLDIASYIARDDAARALSFIDELEAASAKLLPFPDTGRARPELAQGLRSKPYGSYVVFYTPGTDVVRVERILHGARDLEAEFGGEER